MKTTDKCVHVVNAPVLQCWKGQECGCIPHIEKLIYGAISYGQPGYMSRQRPYLLQYGIALVGIDVVSADFSLVLIFVDLVRDVD